VPEQILDLVSVEQNKLYNDRLTRVNSSPVPLPQKQMLSLLNPEANLNDFKQE
jgi:hypothetical protein